MKYSLLIKTRRYLINYLSYLDINTNRWKDVLETIDELTDEIDNYGEKK